MKHPLKILSFDEKNGQKTGAYQFSGCSAYFIICASYFFAVLCCDVRSASENTQRG